MISKQTGVAIELTDLRQVAINVCLTFIEWVERIAICLTLIRCI